MAETIEVIVGVIGRPHGIKGEVAIDLRTDEPERRFAPGQVLISETDRRTFTVVSGRNHNGRQLITFAELVDRTAVEAARGVRLVAAVPATQEPLADEEFYDRQLVGLGVLDAAGADVGTVRAVVHLPAQDLLEIRTGTENRLVPFVAELVPKVDLEAGIVQLADVPGLLSDVPDPDVSDTEGS